MAEVKAALKEAKKAMKENDFEAVSKHCKVALKHDRRNYNALLLFGRACQELGKLEDSKKALMMATQVDPESPVAWQGLAVLCERKPDITTRDETITIYTRLTGIIKNDEEKVDSVYRKLATLQLEKEEPLTAAATLRILVNQLTDQKKITDAWRSIMQILSGIKNLPDEHAPKLQEALENILNESVLGENEGNYQAYLQLLYRTKQMLKLVTAAQTMAAIFPTYYPLEWICRVYVEMTADPRDGDGEFPMDKEETSEYVTRLLSLNKASPWGNLAQGIIYQQEDKSVEAKAHLRVGAERVKNSLLGWKLLLAVQEASNDWAGAEVTCNKSLTIMAADRNVSVPDDEEFESYQTKLRLTRAKALVHMGHKNHLRQAIAILENHACTSLDCGLLLVKSRIKLQEFDLAADDLEKLQDAFGEQFQFKLLSATLHRARGERQKALQLLEEFVQEQPDYAEGHLELGRVYYETRDLKKAQICCMRAGKLDPKLGQAFLYLGHFFRYQDNMEKALKCYEKALSLSPSDDDIGAALSDLYRILGKYEENIRLLHRITSEGGRSSCSWAWLRLGLHHLALQNYDQAIQSFQCTITINPDDSASYECLGDAYLARGAHSAAIKVFTYASQLNPGALYPLYQIAHIKQIVGENLEAIKDYEAVLKREPIKPVEVVSLIGLAEALIASARKYYEQFFYSNLKDACLHAITSLIKAARLKPESSCIWKLMGDACTLLFPVPTSLANFNVPTKLIDREVEDLEELTEVDKLQILQMGARCYGLALQAAKDDPALWHDLGVNTYLQGKVLETRTKEGNESNIRNLMERSLMAIRKSLTLDPANGKTWNSFGIVAAHKMVGEYALAQHALIKSCECQPNAVVWTHLGAFYLTHGETHLAHEAFSQAQALDPSFVTSWVGQALVAESVGHVEAYDLFRHTTLLGIQVESCMGYAHHVTQLACDSSKQNNQRTQQIIKQALPTATDSLVFYTREKEEDVVALNMAGLTLEMMGLYQSAARAYKMAMYAIEKDQPETLKILDGVRCNLGRTYTAQGKVEEAMLQYKAIKNPDYFTQCGLALASLKAGKFEDAYNGYTAALHWLAPDDTQKSHILVALASLQYKFQNQDEAKKLLFQGSQLKGASIHGLLALAAMGLISGDAVLTSAALAELAPHEHNEEHLHHVAFLKASEATARGNTKEAKLILSRSIHQHPSSAPLWRSLARHLLTTKSSCSQVTGQCAAAAICASTATKLAQVAGVQKTIAQDSVTSVMATLGLETSTKRNLNNKNSLRQAQRAVLMCPGSPEAWAMFIAAQVVTGQSQAQMQIKKVARIWSQKESPRVSSWLQKLSSDLVKAA